MTLQRNVSLKEHSNYKIGGNALYFFEVSSIVSLKDGLSEFYREVGGKNKFPIFILGSGTNVLIDDKGFDGLVIKDEIKLIGPREGRVLKVGAGTLVDELTNFCIENSLSGFEWAGGLPGTIGGAVRGNAGAFKGETKDSVGRVWSINLENFEESERSSDECEFNYRTSVFKTNAKSEMIISVEFKLQDGDGETIRKLTQEKIDYRRQRHPLEYPNIGSTFKNIPLEKVPKEVIELFAQSIKNDPFPILPAAKLLAMADLKGKRVGDAQISEKHPNFIVNLGNASSEDVKALIKIAKETIRDKYHIELEEEIYYL